MKYIVWFEDRWVEQAVVEANSEAEAIEKACDGNMFRYGCSDKEVSAEPFNPEIHSDIDYNEETE